MILIKKVIHSHAKLYFIVKIKHCEDCGFRSNMDGNIKRQGVLPNFSVMKSRRHHVHWNKNQLSISYLENNLPPMNMSAYLKYEAVIHIQHMACVIHCR